MDIVYILDDNGNKVLPITSEDAVRDENGVNVGIKIANLQSAQSSAYQKPVGGIPKSDLASAVQTSLEKADTALQSYAETDPVFAASPAATITANDIATWNSGQTSLTFDSTPTANSNNPVTSNGIKDALDLKGSAADVSALQAAYTALTQSDIVVVASANWPLSSLSQNTIYRVTGTTSYSDYMYDGTNTILMATYSNAIDNVPTYASDNLVKSGGVKKAIDDVIKNRVHIALGGFYTRLTTGTGGSAHIGAYPPADYQNLIRGKKIVGVGLYISTIGTLTFVKGAGVGTTAPASYTYTVIQVGTFTSTGYQVFMFDTPFVLGVNEFFGLGVTGDTGKWYIGTSNGDKGGIPFYAKASSSWRLYDTYDLRIDVFIEDSEFGITRLNGKKLTIFGDSISTYDGTMPTSSFAKRYPDGDVTMLDKMWWKRVINTCGMQIEYNNSWDGSAVCTDSSTANRSATSTYRLGYIGSPDIVIIFMGTNDWGHRNNQLGSLANAEGSSLDKTQFYQAYQYLIQQIQTSAPAARILCCSPLQRGDINHYGYTTSFFTARNGHYLYEFRDAIRQIASIYGCEFCDLSACGIEYWNSKDNLSSPLYLFDGLHPNAAGMELIANSVIEKLVQMFSYK